MKNKISLWISALSGVLQLAGYGFYNWSIFTGEISPNASSWFLWAFGSVTATWSYSSISKDWVKDVLPTVCSVACILTFLVTLFIGGFSSPDRFDLLILFITLGIIWFWNKKKKDEHTNLVVQSMIQIETVFSFVPIIREAHLYPEHESLLPWLIWVVAYFFMGVTVVIRYEKWWDLMYPVNYFVLCGITALLIAF